MLPSGIDILVRTVCKSIGLDAAKIQKQLDDALELAKKAAQSIVNQEQHYADISARLARLESAIQVVNDDAECNTVTPELQLPAPE